MPTRALLDFQLAHARARDAVHGVVDFSDLERRLAPLLTYRVHSAAPDRATYLRRPDLGRLLADSSAEALTTGSAEIAFVIADGLSASAIACHAVPTLRACLERIDPSRVAPIVLAQQARVAIGDEIGARLGARLVAVLIGERPGLSVGDSLGIYLTIDPRPGRSDAERNCISNVHGGGLSYALAADRLTWLMAEALRIGATGVRLKDASHAAALGPPESLEADGGPP